MSATAAALPPNPQWETVPKGTPASRCKFSPCTATIYWIERPSRTKPKPGVARKNVRVPVDCDIDGGSSPDSLTDGRGVNHHQTCAGVR